MNFSSEETIKKILKDKQISPSKAFGQNFLIDETTINKIVAYSKIEKNDVVLEIGPGLGALTSLLAEASKNLVAIEKDKKLAKMLSEAFFKDNKVKILEKDILKTSDTELLNILEGKDYKVVANLPYNIALPIIRKFIESEYPPKEMILMLQKEVAEKICSKKSSLPKVAIEFYARATFLFKVPKKLFWPQPKVDGAVIKIDHIQKNIPKIDKELFFKILKAGFASPRKTILNNFSQQFTLEKKEVQRRLIELGVSPQKRGAEIELESWVNLANGFLKQNMIK